MRRCDAAGLDAQCGASIRDYLAGERHAALRSARNMGEQALSEDRGPLEIVAAYRRAITEAAGMDPRQIAEGAFECLAESLAPFESALRDGAAGERRATEEFLATFSHELRNPLMPVIGWVRLLKNHPLIAQDPVLEEGVRSMERGALTLRRLMGDCLDLSRIAEGKIQMERRLVDLNQTVRTSIEAVQTIAAERELSLKARLAPDAVPVLGDATRLEQIVMNLLMNALKYTGPGGDVSVECRAHGDEAQIEVRDTGIGIPSGFLRQIFEPFRRASGASRQSGLGLGLAIARRLVELHGGRIWAESEGVDRGSVFFVALPVASGSAMEDAAEPARPAPEELSGHARILLIEDSEDILFLLRIEFEAAGHFVLTARDGAAGLELAHAHPPDLIISDIKMPGLDGYDLIREIRASPDLKKIPTIALTGFGGKRDHERALAAGFDACISKPGEPHEITELIRRFMKSSSHAR